MKHLGKSSSYTKKSSIRSSIGSVASRYHLPKIARVDSKIMPEVTEIMHNSGSSRALDLSGVREEDANDLFNP